MRAAARLHLPWMLLALVLLALAPARAQQAEAPASDAAETAETDAEAEREWPGDPLVAQIQQGLQDLGYEVAVVDGLMGPNTRGAIQDFQRDEGLTPTGEATDAVKRAIRQRIFRRSQEAARLWERSRLFLRALGYEPGGGAFDGDAAQAALARFAEDHWLELERAFSERLHDVIVRATRADTDAQVWLCDHHMDADAYGEAFEWCRRAARKEVRDAQYYVGWMLYYGRGTERSYERAFDWYRAAARAGDTRAMTYVGLMYRLGRGVERNPDAAQRWYRRAVEAGG